MAITTDPETAIGQIRLDLGDDVEGAGILPNGANYTDEQIQAIITRETVDDVVVLGQVVASLAAMTARRWAKAVDTTVGPLSQRFSQTAERWDKEAKALAARYGGTTARKIRSITVTPTLEWDGLEDLIA